MENGRLTKYILISQEVMDLAENSLTFFLTLKLKKLQLIYS